MGTVGCGSIMKAFTIESPRPNEKQLETVKNISSTSIPIIARMQTDKQLKIASVARAGLFAVSKSTTPGQIEGITNIAANAIDGILNADGTAKILGKAQETTLQDILKMSVVEYGMYAAGQATLASHNIEKAKEGISLGWEWTKGALATIIGGSTGGLGLIGFATMMAKRAMERRNLLLSTGQAIEEFSTKNTEGGQDLKNTLAIAHSTIPVDAKKEFGLS
ncbi:MAG: hypothetical protein A2Z57_06435 [Planctomycetes bacterium RIFCSPHIGHO2_12_39_6]|nr:MAG: hypothetical protein A2Z57_06435 [Planctomycetes bacterium RIFCSPHIGHO2_12_39_6]